MALAAHWEEEALEAEGRAAAQSFIIAFVKIIEKKLY